MRNVYQVLRGKELELERVSREVEALRLVVSLLTEEADGSAGMSAQVAENRGVQARCPRPGTNFSGKLG